MINYVTYKELNIEKYNSCIVRSINSRIYAHSWYLDCVTDAWGVLVLNDYEAVMPLPKQRKFLLSYIYQAPWIQQLGVFSKNEINEALILEFIRKIPNKFVLVDYLFNAGNIFTSNSAVKRINLVLHLSGSFKEISHRYNKNRKRISKQDFFGFVLDKKGKQKDFLDMYKNQETTYKTHKDSLGKLQNLLRSKQASIHIWNVYKNNKIVAGLVWLKDNYRITYLLPVTTAQGKKDNIPTFVIDELVKEYQNTDYILDFEGSMIEGVARFYRSFGAVEEEYNWYRKKL